MNKFIGVIATLILVVMCSLTVFAQGWEQKDNDWYYKDNNGDYVTQTWKKAGESWYWLDEDGKMATAQLIDSDALYCVDEKGQMIQNGWVKVNNEDYDNKWLYFGVNGKAYEDGWKTIKGEKYHFTNRAMDEGFLNEDGSAISDDVDEPWKNAVYYVGTQGAVKKNYWLEVASNDSSNGKAWVFFGVNGKKAVNCKKDINGKTYVFDNDGAIITSFIDATISSAPVSAYMDANGAMLKKGWVYAYLTEDADEQNWFYAKNNGELVKNSIKTINSKKYAFDDEGKMLTGFVIVNEDASAPDKDGSRYMYFTESSTPSEQGAAKTGKQTIEYEGENYTVLFNSRGIAEIDGPKVKKDYYYIDSVLQANVDADYKYLPIEVDGVNYIWNCKNGKASKKGSFVDNDNEIKYELKDGVVTVYIKKDGKWIVK